MSKSKYTFKNTKKEELGVQVLLKASGLIEQFIPELKESKEKLYCNKKLNSRLSYDKARNDLVLTYKKMLEEKENNSAVNHQSLLCSYNGSSIKSSVLDLYKNQIKNDTCRKILLSFLIPEYSYLEENLQLHYLNHAVKEYESFSNEEVESHYISFILRMNNYENLRKEIAFAPKNSTNLYFSKFYNKFIYIIYKTLKKNKDSDILKMKANLQLSNYEFYLKKKKVI